VEVTADRRAMGFIEADVENGTLSAGFPASLVFDVAGLDPIRYVITTPSISEIHLNGAFSATLDGLQTDSLVLGLTTAATLSITGLEATSLEAKLDLASTATLTGSVDSQFVEVVNASTYNAAELDSARAEITASEASTATVRVRESLTGSVATAATLSYIGEDVSVEVDTSLLGSVEELPFVPLPGATPAASPVASPVGASASVAPMQADVTISNFLFEPATVEIAVGGTVTWTNTDTFTHDVAQSPPGSGFTSPAIPQGGTFSHTFDEAGTFDYYCPSHPIMFGQVVVVDA
jgi:plastocyanin